MKKLFILIFVLLLAVSLIGCAVSEKDSGDNKQEQEQEQQEQPEEPVDEELIGHETHTVSETWEYTNRGHYRVCSCGEQLYFDTHTYAKTNETRANGDVYEVEACSVCKKTVSEKLIYTTRVTGITTKPADAVHTINTAEGLMNFAKVMNGEYEGVPQNYFARSTVKLGADIDLTGKEWKAIGYIAKDDSPTCEAEMARLSEGFDQLVFDGDGHSIKNMTVSGVYGVGFFGLTPDGRVVTIKNVTFENATVNAKKWVGTVIGYLHGYVTLSNVTVKNSLVNCDSIRIGGIVGLGGIDSNATITMEGCSVQGCTIKGSRVVAGLVGSLTDFVNLGGNFSISNCSVTGCTFVTTNGAEADAVAFCHNGGTSQTVEINDGYFTPTGCTESGNTFQHA